MPYTRIGKYELAYKTEECGPKVDSTVEHFGKCYERIGIQVHERQSQIGRLKKDTGDGESASGLPEESCYIDLQDDIAISRG
jgi:hypothetical protein